jgi:hypothetical protein
LSRADMESASPRRHREAVASDLEFVVKAEGPSLGPLDAGLVAGVAAGITAVLGVSKYFQP